MRKSWQYLHCDATPSAVSVPQAKTRPPLGWPTAQRLPVAASALGAQHAKNAMVSTYAIRIACRPGTCPEPSRRYEFRASGIRVCSADDAGHATHGRRHDGAKSTGNPDRDFAAMMIPHHQGAIDMAQAELRYGHDERLRRLAQEIVVSQAQEIARGDQHDSYRPRDCE